MDELQQKLWRKVDRYVPYLRMVPFLRGVAVCNNLAFGKVDKESDIDLFIIARAGRMFLVRTLVTFILQILGVRRHGKKIAGRFCLSFFVDDSALNLETIALDSDIYLAYWCRNLRLVIDDGVFSEFANENSWTAKYFEEKGFVLEKERVLKIFRFQKKFENILNGDFGNFLERYLKNWQMKRANEKLKFVPETADILISEHILKFHNLDRRREYSKDWLGKFGSGTKIDREKFTSLYG